MIDPSSQETAPGLQDQRVSRKTCRILSSTKQNSRTLYKVEWIDPYGQKQISWEPLNELYHYMKQVVQFKKERLGKVAFILPQQKTELTPIAQVSQKQQQSNTIPLKTMIWQDQRLYDNMKVIQIKNIPSQILEKYECQMLDKSSGQLFTIVMSDKQLKENFMRDFVKFLEYQVFYKYVQVL